ncbi:MAG: arabinose efflux permease family protein [Herbinix sp.]|jgi:predicted MFS family arabinose efflux permease|nr:arabinose efflux permease family protein [Herbinix sp.]
MNNQFIKEKKIAPWLIFLLAGSCGLIVANLYYAQPLVGPISAETGISAGSSGLIVTMTQLGYAIGLLFLVPLSDLLENRRLVASILMISIIGLVAAALAKDSFLFFTAAILIGLGSVSAQILVPFAAHLAPAEQRGSIVGNVMSGLLLGIMLARPTASLITGIWGWQVVFFLSAIIMVLVTILLCFFLPKRHPEPKDNYSSMIRSMLMLIKKTPVLRRRSLYQAALFGSFSLFWTVVPLYLSQHFHLTQKEIALFGFVGVTGAIAAPIAGRLADKGWGRRLTGIAFVIASLSFVLTHFLQNNLTVSLVIFCIAAILLDMSVSGNLVLGQQAIYALGDEIRGRVNGVFMAVFFLGGAIGSALGGWAYAQGNWAIASGIGFALPLMAFVYFLTDKK